MSHFELIALPVVEDQIAFQEQRLIYLEQLTLGCPVLTPNSQDKIPEHLIQQQLPQGFSK